MTQPSDDLDRLLAAADPLAGEPPTPESERHRAILAAATTDGEAQRPRRRPWVHIALAATAALVIVVAGDAVLDRLLGVDGAAATVRAALKQQVDADSFEATLAVVQDGNGFTAEVRVSGRDAEVHATGSPTEPDRPWSMVMVGDRVAEGSPGGYVIRTRVDGDAVFDPGLLAISSAVLEALAQADVILVGEEAVEGAPATRYDIVLTERSRGVLVDGPLGMPADVDHVSVWIADGLLHQVALTTSSGDSTLITFRNIGEDIEIVLPDVEPSLTPS